MICLGREVEPAVEPIGAGATVTIRAATDAEHHAASIAADRIVRAILAGEAAAEDAGLDPIALNGDDDLGEGLRRYLMAVELGVRLITEWSGVGDAAGQPIEPSREAILSLCREPAVARKITTAATRPLHLRIAEGNASAASPNGAGEAATSTAATAEPPASPAPPAGVA